MACPIPPCMSFFAVLCTRGRFVCFMRCLLVWCVAISYPLSSTSKLHQDNAIFPSPNIFPSPPSFSSSSSSSHGFASSESSFSFDIFPSSSSSNAFSSSSSPASSSSSSSSSSSPTPSSFSSSSSSSSSSATYLFRSIPHTRKFFSTQRSPNIVELQAGQLKGTLVTLPALPGIHLSQVEVFKGIQYASLIKGELRFMPPTSYLEKWDGVRAFLHHKPACPQTLPKDEELLKRMPRSRVEFLKRLSNKSRHQSEECLNLNLYVPFKGGWC